MKKLFFLFTILILSSFVYAVCVPSGSDYCGEIQNYTITNSSGTETTTFNEGEELYMHFDVVNIGANQLETTQVFNITYSREGHGNYPTGLYIENSDYDVDLDVNPNYPANPPVQSPPIIWKEHKDWVGTFTDKAAPGQYYVKAYFRNYNGIAYEAEPITITYNRTSSGWEAAKYTSVSYAPLVIAEGESFSSTIQVRNYNPGEAFTGNVRYAGPGCDTGYLTVNIPAAGTIPFTVTGCTATLGRNTMRVTIQNSDGQLIRYDWPTFNTTTPQIQYISITSSKDLYADGDSGTLSTQIQSKGDVAISAGSYIRFRVHNLKDNSMVHENTVLITVDVPPTPTALSYHTVNDTFNYSGSEPLTYFRITTDAFTSGGSAIPIYWDGHTALYNVYGELACVLPSGTGDCTCTTVTIGNNKAYDCDFSGTKKSVITFSIPGGIMNTVFVNGFPPGTVLEKTESSITILAMPTATFIVHARLLADSLNLTETLAVIAFASLTLFFFMRSSR